MPKKPTAEDARVILKLYDLRREPELRKARQWWLTTFWPKDADEYLKIQMTLGSQENNWLRQVLGYWGIAVSLVANGAVSEKLFFEPSFCGELFFIFAKLRPLIPEIRKKMQNPRFMLGIEKAIMGNKAAREYYLGMEPRVHAMGKQKAASGQ
jgi:hypothetical protein